jgi:hypothetical protein
MNVSILQVQIDKAIPQIAVSTFTQSTVAMGLYKISPFLMDKHPLNSTIFQIITAKTEQLSKKVKIENTSAKSTTFILDHNSNKYIFKKF